MWRSKRTTADLVSRNLGTTDNESHFASSHQGEPVRESRTQPTQQTEGTCLDEIQCSKQNSNHSEGVEWNDNITFDEDDIIKTIDSEGKIVKKKGKIPVSQVWVFETGLKIIVKFNKFKQPIGKGGHVMVKFLGEVAKQGSLFPIGETSWHEVHDCYKVDAVKLTRSKFHIPTDLEIDEMILSHINGKWRTFRCRLKKLYFDPSKTEKQIASNVPQNIIKEQWIRLVSYWFSSTGKELSLIGKKSRSLKAHCHTTGSKSFAQKKHEFEIKEGREPSILEAWRFTHIRKDGSYVDNTNTQDFVETTEKLVDERLVEKPELPKTRIEDEVFNELMYDDENPTQRVIGYGHGVSRSKVFGLKADLRKSISTNDLMDTTDILVSIQKENEHLKNECANLKSQFNQMASALSRNGIVFRDPIGMDDSGRNAHHEEISDDSLDG